MSRQPTIRHRRLCAALRRMRAEAGVTIEQVMAETGWTRDLAMRKENGELPLNAAEVHALCARYGVGAAEEERLVEIAGTPDENGWWLPFSTNVSAGFRDYLELESEAHEVRNFEIDVIPGLLQTESYMRAVVSAWLPKASSTTLAGRVRLRLARQRRLAAGEFRLWAIVDEAALLPRIVTGAAWRAQMSALLGVLDRANVTLQVLPFAAGAHTAIGSPFTWLRLPSPDPGVVLLDNVAGSLTVEDEEQVRRFRDAFDQLHAFAMSPRVTRSFIETMLNEQEQTK